MSRNSEYQFVPTDTATLEALLIASYEKITGTTVHPASPEKLFIKWVSSVILQERVLNNWTGNQNIPSRAEGTNLDALGELFYTSRRPSAHPATCTVRFNISEAQTTSILVPRGTRVTDVGSTLIWETVEDAYIPIGETFVETKVMCQTSGTAGNGYAIGQINTIVDLYDYYSSCANVTESDSGSNEATDDEFYEIMRQSMEAYSVAGSMGAYEYHAKSVSGEIADVAAVRPKDDISKAVSIYTLGEDKSAFIGGDTLVLSSLKVFPSGSETEAEIDTDYTVSYENGLLEIGIVPGGALDEETALDVEVCAINGGRVRIFVLMNDGTIAGEEIKDAVLTACSAKTVRPLTDLVTVNDPEIANYNIDLTYYLPKDSNLSNAEIGAAVDAAVDSYVKWQSAKLGRDINPSHLIGLLMKTGIKRVEVTSPVFTRLRDGSTNETPQIATVGTVTVTNGGQEDE